MQLSLSNFRCYKQITFDFNDIGSILISGQSGIGKSTILMAINFALYDVGSKNIISYGETKCKVEFTFKDLKIVRSRNPSRLIVNDIYEDKVGEEIIYKYFGTHFNVTGYISQNTTETFLYKNAIQKREFLESVKFEDLNLSEKKEKLDQIIKNNRKELDRVFGKLEMARQYLSESEKPNNMEFPIPNKKNIELAIKNENTSLLNAQNRITKISKKMTIKNQELNDLRIVNTFLSSKDENINQISIELEKLTLENKKNEDYIGDENLKLYQKKLQKIKNNYQLTKLISQRDTDEIKIKNMKLTEMKELEDAKNKIETTLWKEYDKEYAESFIKSYQDILKDLVKINSFKDKKCVLKDLSLLENRKQEIITLLEEKKIQLQRLQVMSCPLCKGSVLLEKGVLVESTISSSSSSSSQKKDDESTLSKKIQALSNDLKQIDFEIQKYYESQKKNNSLDEQINAILSQYEDDQDFNETELNTELEDMNKYYKSQMYLENKYLELLDKINNERLSGSYNSYKKELSKLNNQIEVLLQQQSGEGEEEELDENDEEKIRDIIMQEQQKKRKNEQIKSDILSRDNLKMHLMSQMEESKNKHLTKYSSIADENSLLDEIKDLKLQKQNEEEIYNVHKLNLEKIDKYKENQKLMETYKKHLETIKLLEEEEKIESNKYTQAKILKQDFLDSEHLALTNTINDINANANVFLQEFFNDPIHANLSCFKEDKKKNDKPQIYVDIKYKDMNCDLKFLSGGECARVNLAFTLSLAKVFNTPLLLLDETMSSLDEDIADIVFTSIKKHFKNIPVISILHQVTSEGEFDQVIKL